MPAKPNLTGLVTIAAKDWAESAFKYQDDGCYREAIRLYLRILAIEPTQNIETTLGALYELSGETEQALAEHHRAIRKNPGDPASHAGLAGLLGRLNRQDAAPLALAQARSNITESASLYTLACIEALGGDVDQGLIFLSDFLEESPEIGRWATLDPDLCSLRGRPRFDDLLANFECVNPIDCKLSNQESWSMGCISPES